MKKLSFLAILALITVSLFAQTANKQEVELSGDLLALQTAGNLARYGYANESAAALIGAAEILVRVQTQSMEGEATSTTKEAADANTPEFTPQNLLADGRKFAGKDKTMIAWAKEVEKTLSKTTRGAIGGPKRFDSTIGGLDTHRLPPLAVQGGGVTEFLLVGNGASDLDLYIYDEYNRLIASDEGHTDTAFIAIRSARAGALTVVVQNRGRNSNRYMILTN